jgi:hypothetical protein
MEVRQRKLLIVGLVRNCARQIAADVQRLSTAAGPADWFIVESDSDDDTVARLERLQATVPRFRYVSLGQLRSTIPGRIDRIAYCRNRYLQEIEKNPDYRDVDYVVVADLDNLNQLISKEAFASCFEREDWDVCAANQRGPYYDIYALRHPEWSPVDCINQHHWLMRYGISEWRALRSAVYSKMIRIDESADWIPVTSAFGGLAIYRRSVIGSARYAGRDSSGAETCEHVPFHEALGARIFINPRLINAGYTEHSGPLLFFPGIKLRLKLLAKSLIRSFAGENTLDALKRQATLLRSRRA